MGFRVFEKSAEIELAEGKGRVSRQVGIAF